MVCGVGLFAAGYALLVPDCGSVENCRCGEIKDAV